jgi:hypothetical protein
MTNHGARGDTHVRAGACARVTTSALLRIGGDGNGASSPARTRDGIAPDRIAGEAFEVHGVPRRTAQGRFGRDASGRAVSGMREHAASPASQRCVAIRT